MASKSDDGFWSGFFKWEIWKPLGEVWTNASNENPTFVFIVLTSTILIVAGAVFIAYMTRSRQNHEFRSRQQFNEMKRSNDALRDHYVRRIVGKISPQDLSRLVRDDSETIKKTGPESTESRK